MICYTILIRTIPDNLRNLLNKPSAVAVFLVLGLLAAQMLTRIPIYTVSADSGNKNLSLSQQAAAISTLEAVVASKAVMIVSAAEELESLFEENHIEDDSAFPASLHAENSIKTAQPVVPEKAQVKKEITEKPKFSLARPAAGTNYGVKHSNNGVDISNQCGSSITAAAAGTVRRDPVGNVLGGWNGGYGNVVYIDHGNGVKTRYAHLSKVLVSVGEKVSQGEKIGTMGNTGKSTGCHLHFEVHGSGNPLVKR